MEGLEPHIVYSDRSWADIGPHVFPMEKYGMVYRRLVQEHGLIAAIESRPAAAEELGRVHTTAYLDDLDAGHHTKRTFMSELPISREIVEFFVLACGGTIVTATQAMKRHWAAHLGGGFHHAFADRAEGFCYLNDLAVAARAIQADEGLRRIAIVDLDVHQGNGTAAIFAGDQSVFAFSIHQEDNYPIKERGDRDIGLSSYDPDRPGSPFVTDDFYLSILESEIDSMLDEFEPELVLYQGGADPFEEDQLGGFRMTRGGLARRDRTVFRACRERGIPVAITFGGGYAADVDDTVAIHLETVRVARDVWMGVSE